jgi:cytochrome oxidase Cu insertion factor (SCO1/SenC/PrrC family)
MKIETNKFMLVILIAVLLIAASVVASRPSAGVQEMEAAAVTSNQVVELNDSDTRDGRVAMLTNTLGVPVLITDIEVQCSSTCNGVTLELNDQQEPRKGKFIVRFGTVTAEPEFRSFTTGIVWYPGDELIYSKTGGGTLRVSLSGIRLSS